MNFKALSSLAALALVAALAAPVRAQGTLTVYCSVLMDWCQLMTTEFERATVADEQRHVRCRTFESGDELRDGLKLVRRALGLLHAFAQERGIEFETVQLVFEVVHDLHGRTAEVLKSFGVL